MAHIELRNEIDASIDVFFDLARSIDAHLDSMANSREQATSGVTSGLVGLGEQVTWKATHFRVPLKMTSKVTEMASPDRFVDEHVKGPFRRFRHEHRFESIGDGALMIDLVDFASPFGLIGRVVDQIVLQRCMTKSSASGTAS